MDYKIFLQRLKSERKKRGISLREMGEILGVTGQYVSLWENNRAPLKMKDYFSICKILNVPLRDLLEDEKRKEECQSIAKRLEGLPERDLKIIKELLMLMEFTTEDL